MGDKRQKPKAPKYKVPRNPYAVEAKMLSGGPIESGRYSSKDRRAAEGDIEEGLEDYLDGYER